MRPLLVLSTLALLLTTVPVSSAGHIGPCWHEYVEAAIEGARQPRSAVSIIGSTVHNCLNNGWHPCDNLAHCPCDWFDPCPLP